MYRTRRHGTNNSKIPNIFAITSVRTMDWDRGTVSYCKKWTQREFHNENLPWNKMVGHDTLAIPSSKRSVSQEVCVSVFFLLMFLIILTFLLSFGILEGLCTVVLPLLGTTCLSVLDKAVNRILSFMGTICLSVLRNAVYSDLVLPGYFLSFSNVWGPCTVVITVLVLLIFR